MSMKICKVHKWKCQGNLKVTSKQKMLHQHIQKLAIPEQITCKLI